MSRQTYRRAQARALVWAGGLLFAICIVAGALVALTGGTTGLATFLAGRGLGPAAANALAWSAVLAVSAVGGLVLATPLIVAGEVLLILLDQRMIAARHLRVARRIARTLRPPADARSRPPRRVI
jgi:hypothetical protein